MVIIMLRDAVVVYDGLHQNNQALTGMGGKISFGLYYKVSLLFTLTVSQ